LGLARHLESLGRGNDSELFAIDPDQANGADPDLFVDPLAAVVLLLLRMTVGRRNTLFSFWFWNANPPSDDSP
jgi:hypothetical protein